MQTIDRKISPAFKTIEKIEMIHATEQRLRNNIPVYAINAGTQDLIKIEFLFAAGMFHQQMPLQASATNAMLEEGTAKMNAAQIADAVDFYGAFLEVGVEQDHASVILYTLTKHLNATLPVVEDILKNAVFPEHELETHLTNKKQKFLVNNQKVATLARKRFSELVFGEQHPYGRDVKDKDFELLKRNNVVDFYTAFYRSGNCKIVLAGKISDDVFKQLDDRFGGNDWSGIEKPDSQIPAISSATEREQLIYKDDAIQSAIRIGKIMFNKTHPDFHPMQVLNAVYGGYFGSRLMSNIREDKGYTYGIGSGMVSLKNSGYFFISTEVGVDVCKNAIHEIYFEMDRLREELVTEDELQLVKNYLLGTFLRNTDGPFALADRFKAIMEYGLGYDYFDRYIATIKGISASKLREMANTYFDKDTMIELVVGKK